MCCKNCGKKLRKDNKRGYCNSVELGCVATAQRIYNESHREEQKAASRITYHTGNKAVAISKRFKSRYGITEEDKLRLWTEQEGTCAFGGEPLLWEKAQLDHDHKHHPGYGRKGCPACIRGVVCNGHNQRAIAVFDEYGYPRDWCWYRDRRPLL